MKKKKKRESRGKRRRELLEGSKRATDFASIFNSTCTFTTEKFIYYPVMGIDLLLLESIKRTRREKIGDESVAKHDPTREH